MHTIASLQVSLSTEFHCAMCHDTHARDEMTQRRWDSHQTICTQAAQVPCRGCGSAAERERSL
jgi:hypothetical protein